MPHPDRQIPRQPERPIRGAKQFRRYLASRSKAGPGESCGQRLARLIAIDLRIVLTFPDHVWVIGQLWASGEVETLFDIAASGLLHGLALRLYRLAIEIWLGQ